MIYNAAGLFVRPDSSESPECGGRRSEQNAGFGIVVAHPLLPLVA
jgi:hypothetical protein